MAIVYAIGFIGFGIGLLIGSFRNAEGADLVEKVPFVLSFIFIQAYFFSLIFSDVALIYICIVCTAWSCLSATVLAVDSYRKRSLQKQLYMLAQLETEKFEREHPTHPPT